MTEGNAINIFITIFLQKKKSQSIGNIIIKKYSHHRKIHVKSGSYFIENFDKKTSGRLMKAFNYS